MKVRDVKKGEEAKVGDLLIRAFDETYAVKMPEVLMTERRRRELEEVPYFAQKGARVLVREDDGEIVGTVSLFPPGFPGGHVWRTDVAELRFLAIDPARHGGGLADPLVEECTRIARDEWRCAGIALHIRRGAHGVGRYYEKRGYRRTPAGDKDRLPEVYLEAYLLTFG